MHRRQPFARPAIHSLAALLLVVLLAGCGAGSTGLNWGPGLDPGLQEVTFAPFLTYAQALRTVTALGMQPDLQCDEGWEYNGQRDQFSSTHALLVLPTLDSLAPDWVTRLGASPGVVSIREAREAPPAGTPVPTDGPFAWYVCPTPTVVVARLSSAEAGAFAQVAFVPTRTYDDALYTVSNLGLRLVDECYEQALLAQKSPAWHAMGQETTFTATHSLVVQTGIGVTAVTWQQQLNAATGVSSVVTPYLAPCQ